MLDQLLTKAPDRSGVRNIAAQLKVAEFPEQQVAKQRLRQFHITQAIPDAQQRYPQQSQQRIAGTARLAGVNPRHNPLKRGPVQHRLGPIQPLQAGMLKIGAGYEKGGLADEWFLHRTEYQNQIALGIPELCRGLWEIYFQGAHDYIIFTSKQF